jgi:hypothetical protein
MRLIIDVLVALTLVGILAGVAFHYREQRNLEANITLTTSEVKRFESQVALQSALETVEVTEFGWPVSIDPTWFGDNLPVNALLHESYPLVEIASELDRDLEHPRRLMAADSRMARFWYSPYSGVVRARVPADLSDASALALYNRLNGTYLSAFWGSAE